MKSKFNIISSVLIFIVSTILILQIPIGANNYLNGDSVLKYTKTSYTYKRIDQCQIKSDVYRYPDNVVRPALIWIHGGALIFGDRSWLNLSS